MYIRKLIIATGFILATSTLFAQMSINIDSLPPGKSVTVSFDVTIEDPLLGSGSTIANQASISGANFASIISDDPDSGPLADSTRTTINNPVLPIELLSFEAEKAGYRKVLLKWIVATQVNNDRFEIERSENGSDFEKIGEIRGAGSTDQTMSYQFIDDRPTVKYNYYRLRQVDYDGTFGITETRAVFMDEDVTLSVYPNPFKEEFNVFVDTETAGDVELEVTDALGHTILKSKESVSQGLNRIPVQLRQDLAVGVYFLNLSINEEVIKMRLMKK